MRSTRKRGLPAIAIATLTRSCSALEACASGRTLKSHSSLAEVESARRAIFARATALVRFLDALDALRELGRGRARVIALHEQLLALLPRELRMIEESLLRARGVDAQPQRLHVDRRLGFEHCSRSRRSSPISVALG